MESLQSSWGTVRRYGVARVKGQKTKEKKRKYSLGMIGEKRYVYGTHEPWPRRQCQKIAHTPLLLRSVLFENGNFPRRYWESGLEDIGKEIKNKRMNDVEGATVVTVATSATKITDDS